MSLPWLARWLRSPADHEIIRRWTRDGSAGLVLQPPAPPDPAAFSFLALGDSGNSDGAGPLTSPQDAVAACMAGDAALPGSSGDAQFVVHTGDVVYLAGERRLYERNFRVPYAAFLAPGSTADDLLFQLPFLPVPGNHDYYDPSPVATLAARLPVLGAGLQALSHRFFSFSFPTGGSGKGKAYMDAFVSAEPVSGPLQYIPGTSTRIPNRYYTFRAGNADFFALDSNTLDAPAPEDAGNIKARASQRIRALEIEARLVGADLQACQLEMNRLSAKGRDAVAASARSSSEALISAASATEALARLIAALSMDAEGGADADDRAVRATAQAANRWLSTASHFSGRTTLSGRQAGFAAMDAASDHLCSALKDVDLLMGALPDSLKRDRLRAASGDLRLALDAFSVTLFDPPSELCERIGSLSERALDLQRELAMLRRRARYRPDGYDSAQLEWLRRALDRAEQENPEGWRIVYLHHPLYTTVVNHAERRDVQDVRENLLPILKGRVHLVLAGHSHAFEWIRSSQLPETGLVVTGGGGQIGLRGSILEPARIGRAGILYDRLREAGAVEAAIAGVGPSASDGASGPLYHYLKIEVSPDVLTIRPVGVRRVGNAFRREEPMPAYHSPELLPRGPGWNVRRLHAIVVRRDQPPEAVWD